MPSEAMDSTENCAFPYKIDWYQSEAHVILVVFKKKANFELKILDQSESHIEFEVATEEAVHRKVLNLSKKIAIHTPTVHVSPSKAEIKLEKASFERWDCLEKQIVPEGSKGEKNWEALAADADDAPQEEALLNKFFQDIYSKASDESKKAMIKSFTESAGTELSTNWEDVAKRKVTIKPPDGMEWKPWDQ